MFHLSRLTIQFTDLVRGFGCKSWKKFKAIITTVMMMASKIILATSSSPNLSSVAAEKLGKATLDVKGNFGAGFQCEETEFDVTSGFRGGKGDENLEVGLCLQTLKLPYRFFDVHW